MSTGGYDLDGSYRFNEKQEKAESIRSSRKKPHKFSYQQMAT